MLLPTLPSCRLVSVLAAAGHAFHHTRNTSSPYAKWSWASSDPAGGWGPTDVDSVVPLAPTDPALLHGQVLEGVSPTDKPVAGKKPADYR